MTNAAEAPRVWVLNLDADRELGRPLGYSSPRKILDQIAAQRHLTADLVRGEPVLGQDGPAVVPRRGPAPLAVLWCPTPSALHRARRAALRVPPTPALEVLQRVNEKRFVIGLRRRQLESELAPPAARRLLHTADEEAFVRESRFITRESELPNFEQPPSLGRGFRLKRNFGFAGRGQRTITGPLRDDDHLFIDVALRGGGLVIEPAVEIVLALSIHGWVFSPHTRPASSQAASSSQGDAPYLLGEPCGQEIDRYGAPTRVRRLDSAAAPTSMSPLTLAALDWSELLERLKQAGAIVAEQLLEAEYFGPFGLDAFLVHSQGTLHFLPFVDLNARFTLGWSTGMGAERERALVSLGDAWRGATAQR